MIRFATWGLFVAWLAHDVEELITMPHWAGRNAGRLRARFPRALAGVVMLAAAGLVPHQAGPRSADSQCSGRR